MKTKDQLKAAYDNDSVQSLDALSHVRLRPGMYLGRLGDGSHIDDGIYIMLKEVIDNCVDEHIMGFGSEIQVTVDEKSAKVRDFGRGIPHGKVVDCVSMINTGAKFNDEVFQFSVGMNGVGTKAVNALSTHFKVISYRDNKFVSAEFSMGKLLKEDSGKTNEADGTLMEFTPDEEMYPKYKFKADFVEKRVRNYTYLNSGLTLILNGERYKSENGLLDLLRAEASHSIYDPIFYRSRTLEFAISHSNEYGDDYKSFVNGQYTSEGGTHLVAFKEGITRGVNAVLGKSYKSDDVRDGMFATIAIRLKEPVFESQTKNKLGSNDVKSWIVPEVTAAIEDYLRRNPETLKKLGDKIQQNEALRTQLNAVKKEAREASKRVSVRVDKLKDCKKHRGESKHPTMLFVVEGDSAAGSITPSRDVNHQAIFALRGKPENVYLKTRADIYKNKELHNLTVALGIENDIDDLRYDQIIIATDADFDGFHIRNLILTFFLQFYPQLIRDGIVRVLETPLFRVRNKSITEYCFDEAERNAALKKLPGAEVTRFKGLGEISPKEFGKFIGTDMRARTVKVTDPHTIPNILSFYSGGNTPERKEVIKAHLKEVECEI